MNVLDKELRILSDIERFSRMISKRAWGWKELDGWQLDLLLSKERFSILNCSRQSGKSSVLMIKAFHMAITNPNSLIILVAKLDQAEEDMRKCKDLYRAYIAHLKDNYGGALTLGLIEDNKGTMEFGNRSRIKVIAATGHARGFSAPKMVIIDEARDVPDEAFVAVKPMLVVSQGQLIISSTPGGTGGFFYTEWKNPMYKHFFVPWQNCPRIASEFIRNERLYGGEAYVKQEYEGQFLDDVSSLFSLQALQESLDPEEEVMEDELKKILAGETPLL